MGFRSVCNLCNDEDTPNQCERHILMTVVVQVGRGAGVWPEGGKQIEAQPGPYIKIRNISA